METKDPTGHSLGYAEERRRASQAIYWRHLVPMTTILSSDPTLGTVSHYTYRKKDVGKALH